MWTDVNVGEVVAATFSGVVSAIPGASLLGDVVDAVGSNLIEDGVNSIFFGKEFDFNKVARKTFVDLCVPDVMMKKKVPKFIRDIKAEDRSYDVKGTRRLNRFLNLTQVSNVVTNSLKDHAVDRLVSIVPERLVGYG